MATGVMDRTMKASRSAPLTKQQKGVVCRLAAQAWEHQGRPGFADQVADLPDCLKLSKQEASELWRQEQTKKACGVSSLRCAGQGDFCLIMAQFSGLAGRMDQAEYWLGREVGNPERQAIAKLERELAAARDVIEDPESYIRHIARSKFSEDDFARLNEKQLWTLVFDIRRGAAGRRKNRL